MINSQEEIVLRCLILGESAAQTAKNLNVTLFTAKTRINNVLKQLGISEKDFKKIKVWSSSASKKPL